MASQRRSEVFQRLSVALQAIDRQRQYAEQQLDDPEGFAAHKCLDNIALHTEDAQVCLNELIAHPETASPSIRLTTSEQLNEAHFLVAKHLASILGYSSPEVTPWREMTHENYRGTDADYVVIVAQDATSSQTIFLFEYEGQQMRMVPRVPKRGK